VADRVFSISTGLDASTVTPGNTAPDASLTVPASVTCAHAALGRIAIVASSISVRTLVRIHTSVARAPTGPQIVKRYFTEMDLDVCKKFGR